MKIELAHDSIARKVYERASTNDRMRLRVQNLVRVKHQLFETDHTYLTRDEVRFIRPFENQLQLSQSERTFLLRSKFIARKQEISIVVLTFLFIVLLVGSLLYYRHNSIVVAEQNKQLTEQEAELENAYTELKVGYEELRLKDSVEQALLDQINQDELVIRMTTQELQEALTQLQRVNKELKKSKHALEQERDGLKKDKRVLTQQLTQQTRIVERIDRVEREAKETKAALSAVEQSQKLSQRAQTILQSRDVPTEAQYKEAFQLARHAWELSPKNSQAMDVLSIIGNQKLRPIGGGGFLDGERPKITYTHSRIQQIISSIDRRFQYGKLSEAEAKRLLRR